MAAVNLAEYSAAEQAAMVVLSLGQEEAAAVLKEMLPRDLRTITQAMSRISHTDSASLHAVLQRFNQDVNRLSSVRPRSSESMQQLLHGVVGEAESTMVDAGVSLLDRAPLLGRLKWLNTVEVTQLIQVEHPQLKAVILACVDEAQAAAVLASYDESLRVDLLLRMANLGQLTVFALDELNNLLQDYFGHGELASSHAIDGEQRAASLLRTLDGETENKLLNRLRHEHSALSGRIEDLMFTFEQLEAVTTADLQLIFKQFPLSLFATALVGTSVDFRSVLIAAIDKPRVGELEAILQSGDYLQKAADVARARSEIMLGAKKMAAVGEVVLDARKQRFY